MALEDAVFSTGQAGLTWRVTRPVAEIEFRLRDNQAYGLYCNIDQLSATPGARETYPFIFDLYDALRVAGVFGD